MKVLASRFRAIPLRLVRAEEISHSSGDSRRWFLRWRIVTLSLLLVLGATLFSPGLLAQNAQGKIEVRGLIGSGVYSTGGSAAMPLRAGAVVPVGSVVKTGAGGAVDLAFSHNAGVVRLVQNSSLSLDKFNAADSSSGAAVEVDLHLLEGQMLGFEQKLSNGSKYRIKVAQGIADVSGSKYRLNAQGYLVVVEGTAVFAFVPASGDPVAFELHAPPPVYFSPLEGIRRAPEELTREVVLQSKGRLRQH